MAINAQRRIVRPSESCYFPVDNDAYLLSNAGMPPMWGSGGVGGRGVTMAVWARFRDPRSASGGVILGSSVSPGGSQYFRRDTDERLHWFWTTDAVNEEIFSLDCIRDEWQFFLLRSLQRTRSEIFCGDERNVPVDVTDTSLGSVGTADWRDINTTFLIGGHPAGDAYSSGGYLSRCCLIGRYLEDGEVLRLWEDWGAFDGDQDIKYNVHLFGPDSFVETTGRFDSPTLTPTGTETANLISGIDAPNLPRPLIVPVNIEMPLPVHDTVRGTTKRILVPEIGSYYFPGNTARVYESANSLTSWWGGTGAGGRKLTLAAWFKRLGNYTGAAYIVQAPHPIGNTATLGLLNTTKKFYARCEGTGGPNDQADAKDNSLIDGKWQLLIARLSQRESGDVLVGDEDAPPIDVTDSTSSATADWAVPDDVWGVGNSEFAGDTFTPNGEIALVRVFNDWLADGELDALWRDWFSFTGDARLEVDVNLSEAPGTISNPSDTPAGDFTLNGAGSGDAYGIDGPRLPQSSRVTMAIGAPTGAEAWGTTKRILVPEIGSYYFPSGQNRRYLSDNGLTSWWGAAGVGGRAATIAAWVRVRGAYSAAAFVVTHSVGGSLTLRRGTNNSIFMSVNAGAGSDIADSVDNALITDQWQLVVGRLSQRQGGDIFVGDEAGPPQLSDSGTGTSAPSDWNSVFANTWILGNTGNNDTFTINADLALARVFNNWLTDGEIEELWRDWFAFTGDARLEVDVNLSEAPGTISNPSDTPAGDFTLNGAGSGDAYGIDGPRLPHTVGKPFYFGGIVGADVAGIFLPKVMMY